VAVRIYLIVVPTISDDIFAIEVDTLDAVRVDVRILDVLIDELKINGTISPD
jgi:hypothetical protein